jgi:hypothetical protein
VLADYFLVVVVGDGGGDYRLRDVTDLPFSGVYLIYKWGQRWSGITSSSVADFFGSSSLESSCRESLGSRSSKVIMVSRVEEI